VTSQKAHTQYQCPPYSTAGTKPKATVVTSARQTRREFE